MIGQISEHLISKLERIIGLPAAANTPRLRQLIGLGPDRCDIALFRQLDFESLERRTMFSADLGFAFDSGSTGDDIGYEIASDNAGNIYITGEFEGTVDFDPGAGVTNLVSNGGSDVFVAKYNDSGELLWAQSLGGAGNDAGLGITVDSAGKVYVSGNYSGAIDFDPTADTDIKAGGTQDAFVLALDADGSYSWSATFNSTNEVFGYDLEVNAAGDVYVAGGFTGTTDFDPLFGVVAPVVSNGDSDGYLTKLDSTGRVQWVKTFGNFRDDAILAIDLDSSSNVVMTGFFETIIDMDPGAGTTNLIGGGLGDTFVTKLDDEGNLLWTFAANGTNDNIGRDIVVDSNDDIIFTGSFEQMITIDPGGAAVNLTSFGGSDVFVTKVSSAGAVVWAKQLGGAADDIAWGVAVDSANNVFIAGEFRGTADFDPDAVSVFNLTATGSYGAFVVKLTVTGAFDWAAAADGAGDVVHFAITVDINDRAVTTGALYNSADFDPTAGTHVLTSSGNADFYVATLASNTTPTTSGIGDVNVTEDDPDAVVDLFAAFNDSEDSDANLTYSVVGNTNPALFASLAIDGVAGTLTLSLAGNAYGTAVITVRATDSGGEYVETSFTVNVAAYNDTPTTSGIADVAVVEDAGNSVIDLFDAFADVEDTDAALTYTITGNSNPALFSAVIIDGAAGTLTLAYAANAYGSSQIRVRATDQNGAFVEAVFDVVVSASNDQPTTVGINNITVAEDTTSSYINLYSAFADVEDGVAPLVYSVTGNTNTSLFSVVSIDGSTGTLILNYAANQNGTANITVRARDLSGLFVETTFTVTITPKNDAPVAQADAFRLWQNSRLTSQVSVLDNDSDLDGDSVVAALVSGPAHGNLYLNGDGTFTYVPDAGFYGVDQFTYAAYDGNALSATTTVSLSVARLPSAVEDRYVAIADTPLEITSGGVLKNDTLANSGAAAAVLVEAPEHGTVELKSDGSFLYIPDAEYIGVDSFSYRLETSEAASEPAVVTIEVLPLPAVFNDNGETGLDDLFDSVDDLLNESTLNVVISSSELTQSDQKDPYSYYADETTTAALRFGASDSSAADYEYYSRAGGGSAAATANVDYQSDGFAENGLRDAESGGGGEDLAAETGPMQLQVSSLALPVDDDLLLNSAYLDGDESAFVFDRILQKSSTAQTDGEPQPDQTDREAIAANSSDSESTDNAEAPWRTSEAELAAHAVDEVWANVGDFMIQTDDELFASGSSDEADNSELDHGMLTVIASTVAAGQLSLRSKAVRRNAKPVVNYSPPPTRDPQT